MAIESAESETLVSRGMLDWLVKYAVPLFGLIGAALYGVLRLAYVFFYLHLRATPEEVGYGYSEVLAGQLIGAIELVLLVAAILFGIGSALAFASSKLLHVVRRKLRMGSRKTVWVWRAMPRFAARCGVVAVILVLAGLPVLAWLEGAEAAKGFTVRNVYLTGTIRLPVLAVEAVPARIDWVQGDGNGRPSIASRQCLLYVGRSGGTSVFYDVATEESLRVPSDLIVITLQNTTGVPYEC